MMEITTKTELITALKDANQRAENWFLEILASNFFTRKVKFGRHRIPWIILSKHSKTHYESLEITENYFTSDVGQT